MYAEDSLYCYENVCTREFACIVTPLVSAAPKCSCSVARCQSPLTLALSQSPFHRLDNRCGCCHQLFLPANVLFQNEDLAEQCVWALGNIAADSPYCRDILLKHNTIEALMQLM